MPSALTIAIDLPAERPVLQAFKACARPLVLSGLIDVQPLGHKLVRATVKVAQERATYLDLLECLIKVDQWSLQRWPFPPLYSSGVRYAQEPFGSEIWLSVPALYLRGKGDCGDLVSARAAEQRNAGHFAKPELTITGRTPSGGRLFHFLLRNASGQEDPSRALGMPA